MVGIFVNGLAAPGLNAVHISGLTVKNANLEGILVLNASAVTVAGNTVTNNNLALVNGVCTMLPVFEPGELQDCGEGIHLQAVGSLRGDEQHGDRELRRDSALG